MRLAVLQHVPFEGPAGIADWAAARGVPMSLIRLDCGEPLPELNSFDMLAIMGGSMSANDKALYAWLGPEIALARDAAAAGKTVLGVCLGAQIMAKALGAKVYAGQHREIGWFPVESLPAAHPAFDGIPAAFPAFHWHGETFDMPAGAERLAQTAATPNQAFAMGPRVLGLQFHLEATAESVKALLDNEASSIGQGPFEQSAGAILASFANCEALRPVFRRLLDNLTGMAQQGR